MKIAWFCVPAHGHTNPTLGVVRELTAAGHEVYYFSFEQFREKIERAGAVFIGCDGYDFEMEDKANSDRVGKDMPFAVELLVSSTLALDEMVSAKIREISPDVIVTDSIAYWGKLCAMKFGLPWVMSTTTFAFNRYSSSYLKRSPMETVRMLLKMPKMNRQLDRLRAAGYPVKDLLEIIGSDNAVNTIVYTSPLFQPRSETFSDRYRFVGPSIRPVEEPLERTEQKTVYVSLGTVNRNEEFYKNAVEAFRGTPYRVIVSLGTSADIIEDVPENVELHEHVDQMAVLSVSDAFITHCGMNSASEGLYFGVPLVLFPQTYEQGAVARRVEELGAGVPLKSVSPEDIRGSVEKLLSDPSYKAGAEKVSASFKACGGAPEAAAFIEEVARGMQPAHK